MRTVARGRGMRSARWSWSVALLACAGAAACSKGADETPTAAPVTDPSAPAPPVKDSTNPPSETTFSSPLDASVGTDASVDHAPSAGCGHATKDNGFLAGRTLSAGGNDRTYDIFVPPGYDVTKPTSVIVVFHADSPISLRPYLPIEAASGGQAIVVYPYGFGAWDLSKSTANYDFVFIDALLASLKASYCIDPGRVFAYGYSNGGFFLNMYACHRGPSAFRGIAVNSGGLYPPEGEPAVYNDDGALVCPKPPVAALVIHGTQDVAVNYQSDGIGALDSWLATNKCKSTSSASTPAPCVLYDGCGASPVGFCPVVMGHQIWAQAAAASWGFFTKL